MSQCVPSWDLDESPIPSKLPLQTRSNSLAPDVPSFDNYEVAELTWKNGQLAMHGLGPPRVPNNKPVASYGGTLESIVNQATRCTPRHHGKSAVHGMDEVVPWFNNHPTVVADAPPVTTSATLTMDALVPSASRNTPTSNRHHRQSSFVHVPGVDGSTHVGSCSGATISSSKNWMVAPRVRVRSAHEWSSPGDMSVSGSGTCGGDSRQVTFDTFDREFGTTMFTSTSMGSPENTSSDRQCTNRTDDSVCHSRPQREAGDDEEDNKKGSKNNSSSTKRKRAAAIHNQSERKRRDKINQRMKTLQKLVPNSSKTDKASMLDEVIEYLKQLQAQVHMMNRMNMSPMTMLPLAMQQHQLQMSMMGMGIMGMGMGVVDINPLSRPNIHGLPPFLHPATAAAFMQQPNITSWPADSTSGDRLTATNVMPDPLAAFLACQSQSMSMDAYSRMAALYQQFQQPAPSSAPKN